MEPNKMPDQPTAGVSPTAPQQPPAGVPVPPPTAGQAIDGIVAPPTSPISPQPTAPPTPTPVAAPASYPLQTVQTAQKGIQYTNRLGRLKGLVSLFVFIGGVFLAAFLINQFIFQSYFVEGTSMVPTLQDNDRLIIEKVDKTAAVVTGRPYLPNRGDIVVLDSNLVSLHGREQLIKRVIGLPGDTINIRDGVVTVKNQENPDGFDVDKALGLEIESTYSSQPLTFIVPKDHVFVMGDNRTQNGSQDSRAFGPVPSNKLEGRLWARILPLDKTKIF